MSVSDHLPYSHFVPPHHHHSHHQSPFLNYYQDFSATNTTSHYQQPNILPPVSLLTNDLPRRYHQSPNPVNHQTTTSTNPAFTMNTLSTDEMERFQKLSNEFEADVPVYWREKTYENCQNLPADT